uniref:Uncharacterized protein n=1 Tax=Rhizophora mucronata TaxID=61149 RepID=A0A2P2R295_RHIMU
MMPQLFDGGCWMSA